MGDVGDFCMRSLGCHGPGSRWAPLLPGRVGAPGLRALLPSHRVAVCLFWAGWLFSVLWPTKIEELFRLAPQSFLCENMLEQWLS